MAAKITRLTHKIAIQLHLVGESCTISSFRSRRPVRKLMDTPSHIQRGKIWGQRIESRNTSQSIAEFHNQDKKKKQMTGGLRASANQFCLPEVNKYVQFFFITEPEHISYI